MQPDVIADPYWSRFYPAPHAPRRAVIVARDLSKAHQAQFKSEVNSVVQRIAARPHQANLGHTQFIAHLLTRQREAKPKTLVNIPELTISQ